MKKLTFGLLALMVVSFISCTKDVGTISVTYQEASAIYGDLDEIRSQAVNTEVRNVENPGKIYVGNDLILLGEEEHGVHVLNNSDPANPYSTNFINIPGNREFFVKGDFLYAESYYDMLKLDISNPNDVVLVARAQNIFQEEYKNAAGETLLGFSFTEVSAEVDQNSNIYADIMDDNYVYYDFARNVIPKSAVPSSFAGNSNAQSGTVNRITHSADHVYIINNHNMSIIDDVNGFTKVEMNQNFWAGNEMETIFPYENKLFVGSRSEMTIFDISSPQVPVREYDFRHVTSCDPVLPIDEVAYITLRTSDFSGCPGTTNALIVLDLATLSDPVQVADIPMVSPYGMTTIGDRLFVGEGQNGLKIFDVTDRKLPVLEKQHDIEAYDVIEHPTIEGLLLVAGPNGLEQYYMNETLDFVFESRFDY